MVELELKLGAVKSMRTKNLPRAKIDILQVGLNDVDVPQNAPQRIHNVGGRKIASRHLVQHRREENKILPRDQCYLDIRPPSQMLVQIFRRVEPGKPATGDYDLRLLHEGDSRIAPRL